MKKLSASEVGTKEMHDKYLTFKSKVDYLSFYGKASPIWIEHIDKASKVKYLFRYDNQVSNGEVRLYEMKAYYEAKNAVAGDVIYIEKTKKNDTVIYYIDILRNNIQSNP